MSKNLDYIKKAIIDVPDFPKKGITFKDITPIFKTPEMIIDIIDAMNDLIKDIEIDVIVGAESRGFLFGLPLAMKMKKPFVLIRKPNKLPREVYSERFDLEYGSSNVELQKQDILPGQRVLVVDDLLATGGTVNAIERLIFKASAIPVVSIYMIELEFLKGKSNLKSEVFSIFKY